MAGLLIGAWIGLLLRTNNVLGIPVETDIAYWTDAGLPEEEIARRMLEHHYPYDARAALLQPASGSEGADVATPAALASVAAQIAYWSGYGLEEEVVATRFLDILYPTGDRDAPTNGGAQPEPHASPSADVDPRKGWLFAYADDSICREWRRSNVALFPGLLVASSEPSWRIYGVILEQQMADIEEAEQVELKNKVITILCTPSDDE